MAAIIERSEAILGKPESSKPKLPFHVIIFAGHQFDQSHREHARFPIQAAEKATAAIEAKRQQLNTGQHELVLLGSVSPGADIL